MELHQLEYVVAVHKYRQFSQASEAINISQPTLSYGIKSLEKELGIDLFVRTTRSVQLTTAGEEFVVYAQRILSDVKNARNAMQAHRDLCKGNLKVGAIPSIFYWGVTPVLASFQKAYPGINMEIREEDTGILLKKMSSGELDAAFINSCHVPEQEMEYYPLIEDKMVMFISKTHRLAKTSSVELADLAEERFLLVSGLKNDFIKQCRLLGFEPNISMVSIQALTVKGLVEEGLGIAPFTSHIATSLCDEKTTAIDFTPVIKRTTALAVAKNNNMITTRTFRDFILKNIKQEGAG